MFIISLQADFHDLKGFVYIYGSLVEVPVR